MSSVFWSVAWITLFFANIAWGLHDAYFFDAGRRAAIKDWHDLKAWLIGMYTVAVFFLPFRLDFLILFLALRWSTWIIGYRLAWCSIKEFNHSWADKYHIGWLSRFLSCLPVAVVVSALLIIGGYLI